MSSLSPISCDAQSILGSCIFSIFGFLPPEDLARVARVSREWKHLADNPVLWDLQAIFRSRGHVLNIIDKKVWAECLDLDAARVHVEDSLLPRRTVFKVVRQMFDSLEIEGDLGITLLTLPLVTLRNLRTFFPAAFRFIHPLILGKHGDTVMNETGLVAITNGILKGSRGLSSAAHKALVLGKECEMVELTAVVALAILTERRFSLTPPIRLFSGVPWTFTRGVEKVGDCHVVVGDFTLSGLHITSNGSESESIGVACLRRIHG